MEDVLKAEIHLLENSTQVNTEILNEISNVSIVSDPNCPAGGKKSQVDIDIGGTSIGPTVAAISAIQPVRVIDKLYAAGGYPPGGLTGDVRQKLEDTLQTRASQYRNQNARAANIIRRMRITGVCNVRLTQKTLIDTAAADLVAGVEEVLGPAPARTLVPEKKSAAATTKNQPTKNTGPDRDDAPAVWWWAALGIALVVLLLVVLLIWK